MTQMSLQDCSCLTSLEIPACKSVIQSVWQSCVKTTWALQREGLATRRQPANCCYLLRGKTLLVQLLHVDAQARNSHTWEISWIMGYETVTLLLVHTRKWPTFWYGIKASRLKSVNWQLDIFWVTIWQRLQYVPVWSRCKFYIEIPLRNNDCLQPKAQGLFFLFCFWQFKTAWRGGGRNVSNHNYFLFSVTVKWT